MRYASISNSLASSLLFIPHVIVHRHGDNKMYMGGCFSLQKKNEKRQQINKHSNEVNIPMNANNCKNSVNRNSFEFFFYFFL